MSKVTSWDRWAFHCDPAEYGHTTSKEDAGYSVPVRVVIWPEGAPDPSEVPHAGEKVRVAGRGGEYRVRNGIPHLDDYGDLWYLRMTSGAAYATKDITRIPDSPTVELPNGKKYRESDVMERCAELEEVS